MSEYFDPLAEPFHLEGTNGEAVVLVHGFTGTPAQFRLLAPALNEQGYSVEVPLLTGHGTSIDLMARSYRNDWIRSVERAVEAAWGHNFIHLFGFSMGGLIAVARASDLPITSLTTLNAPLKFRDRRIHLSGLVHRVRPRVYWDEPAPDDRPQLDPEAERLWLTYDGFPTRQAHELVQLSKLARQLARKVPVPTLIIQSRADESTDPESGLILHDLIPDSRLVWLERAIHTSLLDDERNVIADELLNHLADSRPAGHR